MHFKTVHLWHRMASSLLIAVLALAAVFLSTGNAFAQDPAAEALIERYLTATGGEEAFSKLTTRIIKGEFAIPEYGMLAPMESYSVPPDKSYLSIDSGETGRAASGVQRDIVWDVNPMAGARILRGSEKASRLRQATWDPLLDWRTHFQKAEVGDDEEVLGKTCSRLILTPHEGAPITMLFDKESGLPLEIRSSTGGIPSRSYPSDYREVDGIKIPFKLSISTPQYSAEIRLISIEHNVVIPAERFDPPAEIKAILEK